MVTYSGYLQCRIAALFTYIFYTKSTGKGHSKIILAFAPKQLFHLRKFPIVVAFQSDVPTFQQCSTLENLGCYNDFIKS